jgi:hypothetical protein
MTWAIRERSAYNAAMPLHCNIDAKGKLARLIWGIVMLIIGIVLLFVWALPYGTASAWIVMTVCLALGAFGIFEARRGWCAVRAMGFKTPM